MPLRDHLPPGARRRLGRIKRAVLDQPEPAPPAARAGKPAQKPRPKPPRVVPVGVAPPDKNRPDRLTLRRTSVFEGRDPSSSVLEIGPAHNAILPKRDGFRTKTVDYLDREGLVEKYAAHPQYDPEDIEEVDYVLPPGATMSEAIDERFDIVLASHVLEHTTSVVHFLNECSKLLLPGGRVALVVPDHRYCFDRFRQRSSLGRIIDASMAPPDVHSVGTTIDFTLNAVRHRDTTAWAPAHKGDYAFVNDLDAVRGHAERARAQDGYIDMHNWVFSPHYLRLVLHDLASLGYIDLWEESFHPTVRHEFFVNLGPQGAGVQMPREELLQLADAELRSLDVPTWASGAEA